MKKRYALLFAIVLMFSGCGEKDGAGSEENAAVNEVEDMKQSMKEAGKEISKYTSEDLKKATPLSNEQIKALLPESLDGMKRKSYNITKMGFNAVEAKYDDDTRSISLSILDGAGEVGAAMMGMTQLGMNAGGESESEHGYMKQFSLDSAKGIEEQDRSSDGSSITNKVTFIVVDRFFLTFEAQGIEMDKIKSIVEESKLIDSLEDTQ